MIEPEIDLDTQLPPETDLGQTTSLKVLLQRFDLKGLSLIDIGSGDLTFSLPLAEAGAQVLGVDPDPVQAELNRNHEWPPRVSFQEASAESLPVDDQSMDGALFSFSLHHIPASLYPQVFAEVRRVLRPDGFLFVVEPLDSPFNQVLKLFHDEDHVRALAQAGLAQLAVPMFEQVEVLRYSSQIEYESFEQFAQRMAGRSFNDLYTAEDVWRDEVREAFEQQGAPDYRFDSPKRAVVLRRPIQTSANQELQ